METISALPGDTGNTVAHAAGEAAAQANAAGAPLRLAGRPDLLTAQRVEVGIILQAMLGTPAAAEYLENNAVDPMVCLRVLFQPHRRRGRHDAFGILC
jgi:hypothetical protein